MEEALLNIEGVNKSFGKRQVLKTISLSLRKGEFVSLVGVSGSGKSTLLNIIAGLEEPDSGRVELDAHDITKQKGMVSYMFQKDLLFPHYTILDNVILPLVIGGEDKKSARAKASPLFAQFGLDGTQNQYPAQLSGGMRQRAAFLRTYLTSKQVLLLDEPFSALDMITKNRMHEWYLETVRKLGLTTLLITHDIEEAILLSDRILIMNNVNETEASNIIAELRVEALQSRTMDFCYTEQFARMKQRIYAML
ncbi:MAG: ABC transporter ATP-binding protein [Treponema sp.]|nr:ABC transporter ATP-binding protein [Treponema sp.]